MGKTIAEALGVSQGAVRQWLKRTREGGVEALYAQPPTGPTSRLTTEQLAQLPYLLARGAEAFGFIGEVWTAKRGAAVIREEFGSVRKSLTVTRLASTSRPVDAPCCNAASLVAASLWVLPSTVRRVFPRRTEATQ
jgi:transposase